MTLPDSRHFTAACSSDQDLKLMLSINMDVMDSAENYSSTWSNDTYVEPSKESSFQRLQQIQYQGFWYTPEFVEKIKSLKDEFVARPGDIVLCSFPKTGTTWLKSLIFAITTRSQYNTNDQSPLLTEFPHHCIPFIENDFGGHTFKECLEGKHRLVATHIPYTSLPSSVEDMLNSGSCKIVYVYRDPKDVVVSLWHHINLTLSSHPIPFESLFEIFCEGKLIFGPYWSHMLGYLEVCKEQHPEAILFLKYEDLKSFTEDNVKRLAEFLGCPFSREEEEEGEMGKIIQMCNFENLNKLKVNETGTHEDILAHQAPAKNKYLFRKGKVGDWKNMLTPEMERRMNLIFEEKLKGSGISFSDVKS